MFAVPGAVPDTQIASKILIMMLKCLPLDDKKIESGGRSELDVKS